MVDQGEDGCICETRDGDSFKMAYTDTGVSVTATPEVLVKLNLEILKGLVEIGER